MAQVLFFEKPGCINNTKQKRYLRNAGHVVVAIDILKYEWSEDLLRPYFSSLAVVDWFNQSAPKIKSGEIYPEELTDEQAIKYLVKDPILIKRPLMKANNECKVGFNYDEVNNWIGLDKSDVDIDLESCPQL